LAFFFHLFKCIFILFLFCVDFFFFFLFESVFFFFVFGGGGGGGYMTFGGEAVNLITL